MGEDSRPEAALPAECLARLSVSPVRTLGGRVNRHWLVATGGGGHAVLREYAPAQHDSVEYEHAVLRRLRDAGWPVPELLEEPLRFEGRLFCLFGVLPGEHVAETRPEQRRARGRLLARLHATTVSMTDLGQRRGFVSAEALVADAGLLERLRRYERLRPDSGHVLRWHLERARERFAELPPAGDARVIVHGDLAPWNLLFEGDRLSGVLDLEGAHLNLRVSDFANAWRRARARRKPSHFCRRTAVAPRHGRAARGLASGAPSVLGYAR